MSFEFIRLEPTAEDDPTSPDRRLFTVELPDADSDQDDCWASYGRLEVRGEAKRISTIDFAPTALFWKEVGSGPNEELIETLALWAGWESGWAAPDEIPVRITEATSQVAYLYSTGSGEVRPA